MIPIEEMQEQFDGLFYKAISRILFSPDKNRKRYADALASMFSAMQSSDGTITFRDAYNELQSAIEQSPKLIHSQEDLIASFEGKFIPINKRIASLEIQISHIGKIEEEIKKLDLKIKNRVLRESFNEFKKEITCTFLKNKKVAVDDISKLPVSMEKNKDVKQKIPSNKRLVILSCNHEILSSVKVGKNTTCKICAELGVAKTKIVRREVI